MAIPLTRDQERERQARVRKPELIHQLPIIRWTSQLTNAFSKPVPQWSINALQGKIPPLHWLVG